MKEQFSRKYERKELLGKGAYSIVYRCVEISSKKEYAVKVVEKNKLNKRELMRIDIEARICRKLNHPNIVRLVNEVSEPNTHYFIIELVIGGELFDDLAERISDYTEAVAAKCMRQLLETVVYIHSVDVVHRDIKPENILIDNKENKNLKLADFGLAIEVPANTIRWFGMAGSPEYMAPEVLEMKPYGRPVDCWACGVVLFIMLCGYQPFTHENERKLFGLIKAGDYDLSTKHWANTTEEAKDLVRSLMCIVPTRRLTAAEALKHPWFDTVTKVELTHREGTIEGLKTFNAKRKFRAAVHTHMAVKHLLSLKVKDHESSRTTTTRSTSSKSSI